KFTMPLPPATPLSCNNAANNYKSFQIFTAVALVYLVLNLLSSQAFSLLERRMNPIEQTKRKQA
ncbi:MAG: hypothetical protein IGR76_00805, partial [Synechococcales cyanobacterium T60_A2020_003]|nr:hypothetical protein [Synechococcales cyanobacterium T60_A2020_003]